MTHVTFVDTNVPMHAVGGPHPMRDRARQLLEPHVGTSKEPSCTSAEVLQELLHAYVPVGRFATLDAALQFAESALATVFPIEEADVRLARTLAALGARDLIHVASCRRRGIGSVMMFDRSLAASFKRR